MTVLVTGGAGFIVSNFVLDWQPTEFFESGIRKTVCWYLDHQDWVANVTSDTYRESVERQYS